jgi:branched-chain amino acid transport system permease protein
MTILGLRTQTLVWLVPGAIVLIALPLVVKTSFAIDIFIRILLFSFIGVAWNLMGGYAKQLSLGHAAYFGLGACRSAGCVFVCAAPISPSPPSQPRKR